MHNFSFIHAADLHLDSPFRGITTESTMVANALRSATFEAYKNLIDRCIREKVDFLVIAGDVYDGADRSVRAQLCFLDGLKTLCDHGIPAYVVHGNHDPLDGWASTIDWPDNVTIFGGEHVETYRVEVDGEPIAVVSGLSYKQRREHRNLAKQFTLDESGLFQIGLLHCNCGGSTGHEDYAPCRLEDLTQKGINYWALGHVHERQILCSDPYVVYSGNIQGRSIRESGRRGCYLVHVENGVTVDLEFLQLNAVIWCSSSVSIETIRSLDGLERTISQECEDLSKAASGQPVVCRLELTGRGPLYNELRRDNTLPEILERAQLEGLSSDPFVWLQKLEMRCLPEIDFEKRREMDDLLGQVLRKCEDYRRLGIENGKDRQNLIDLLKPALNGLYGNSRAAKVLDPLSAEALLQILDEAELLCVDLLDSEA